MLSRDQIESGIEAIDAKVSRLNAEIDAAALASIHGDGSADARMVAIQAEIARDRAKRSALVDSRDMLDLDEARAVEAADEARRAEHMRQAREHARRVIATAAKIDKLVADFKASVAALGEAETATWRALRSAGVNVSKDVTGRTNIVAVGLDRMTAAIKGLDRFANNQPRHVADIAKCGWQAIIDQSDEA